MVRAGQILTAAMWRLEPPVGLAVEFCDNLALVATGSVSRNPTHQLLPPFIVLEHQLLSARAFGKIEILLVRLSAVRRWAFGTWLPIFGPTTAHHSRTSTPSVHAVANGGAYISRSAMSLAIASAGAESRDSGSEHLPRR